MPLMVCYFNILVGGYTCQSPALNVRTQILITQAFVLDVAIGYSRAVLLNRRFPPHPRLLQRHPT